MTIQLSLSDDRFSSSQDEKPHAPNRMGSFESGKGSDHADGSNASCSMLGSDLFQISSNLESDDSVSCNEDDLEVVEAQFERKYGLNEKDEGSKEGYIGKDEDEEEDDNEQNFSYLYGHMSRSSVSLTDDNVVSVNNIKEQLVKPVVVDYGYGEASPNNEILHAVDYGYCEATPDSDRPQQVVDYGNGGAAPDSDQQHPVALPKFVRRSSLKQMNGSSHSRASLCVGDEIEVQLPCQDKTIKRRRSITFNEEVDVNHIEKVTAMDGKREELWFQKQDFKNIAIGAYRDVHKAKKGCKMTDTRGLENILNEEGMDERVDKALDIVLNTQDIQYDKGIFDEVLISALYTLSAVDSKIDALIRARRDEREAEEYLRETRRVMGSISRRMSM